jgi:hypothetical protein
MRRLLLVTVLVLAGCTATETGAPTAGDPAPGTTTTTTTTATTSTTTTTAVTRPRAVDMAGVDVCGLLGSLPLANFGLDRDRPPVGGPSAAFPGSRDCFANGLGTNLGLTLVAVTGQGAAEFADGASAEITETEVGGFRLYVLRPPVADSCFGALDVNSGQLLFVNYGLAAPGEGPVTPQETLCGRVPEIAGAALERLQSV